MNRKAAAFILRVRPRAARVRLAVHSSNCNGNLQVPTNLTLYQRDDCHLCDLALAVLARARAPEFASVFIDGDDALEARYGIRVPVLCEAGSELDWPFDEAAVQRFLQGR